MLSIDIKQSNPDYIYNLITSLKSLQNKKVVAGFPRGKLNAPHYEFKWAKRKEKNKNPPSIIDVAIKNNYGIGVPRRDFMTPAVKKWQKYINESLETLKKEIEDGRVDGDKFLKLMGLKGADLISQSIIDLKVPPNSPYTIEMKGSSNPLVDSGDMSRAPRYEIRKAGNK